jgi:ABC-2 type transport system ATP-binding protein
VGETVYLFRSFYLQGRDPEEVLVRLSLDEKRNARVGKLSGGQKQRLAVACALVGDPELLFLDEPTTGLDPQSRLQLWQQVMDFRAGGGTVLLTTHSMDEAERLCDRVAIVDRGQVIALGTPAELISSLHAANVIEFELVAPRGLARRDRAGPPVPRRALGVAAPEPLDAPGHARGPVRLFDRPGPAGRLTE